MVSHLLLPRLLGTSLADTMFYPNYVRVLCVRSGYYSRNNVSHPDVS